ALFRGRIVREQPSTRNGTYRCCGKSLSSASSFQGPSGKSRLYRPRFTHDRRLFDQRAAVELAVRKDSDRFVKQGAYGELQARLRRQSGKLAEIPTVVLSAFDRSTRLLPFLFYDTLMFPAGAGAIANALNQA